MEDRRADATESSDDPLDRLAKRLLDPSLDDVDLEEPSAPAIEGSGPPLPPALLRLRDYTVVRCLGRGGMGAVYLAHQRSLPDKQVALKVLPGIFATDPVLLARFRNEASTASRLNHPGVVAVLDIQHENDVHFQVQELVEDGRTLWDLIREARDARTLPKDWFRTAAELFAKIAEALAAVHAAHVLHRDIKPANILLTPQGEPKVGDFGLAKDTEAVGGVTLSGSPGTLNYKSPEQLDKGFGEVDQRSDVFSLGVTMYEALTLTRLFPGDKQAEVQPAILGREVEDLRLVRPGVPKDLSTLCRKCLEKRPEKRYQTMAEVAADLRRYLRNEPILAREPSRWDRMWKWSRRNPGVATGIGVGAVALVVISVVALVAVQLANEKAALATEALEQKGKAEASARLATAQAAEAKRSAQEATEHAQETVLVADFQARIFADLSLEEFGHGLLTLLRRELEVACVDASGADPSMRDSLIRFDALTARANMTNVAREALQNTLFAPAMKAIQRDQAQHPNISGALQAALSSTMRELGMLDLALVAAREALLVLARVNGSNSAKTLSARTTLASILQDQGNLVEAAPIFREVVAGYAVSPESDVRDRSRASNNLGVLLRQTGQLDEAEQILRQAVDSAQSSLGANDRQTITSFANLASVLRERGRNSEAGVILHEALTRCQVSLGEDNPTTTFIKFQLARTSRAESRFDEAERLYREILPVYRARLGDYHQKTLNTKHNLVDSLFNQGRYAEAEVLAREAMEATGSALGLDHPDTRASIASVAALYVKQKKFEEALQQFKKLAALSATQAGARAPETLVYQHNMAVVLRDMGRLEEAEPVLREVLDGWRAVRGNDNPRTLVSARSLGSLLLMLHKTDEGLHLLEEAVAGASCPLPSLREALLELIDLECHRAGAGANGETPRLRELRARLAAVELRLQKKS